MRASSFPIVGGTRNNPEQIERFSFEIETLVQTMVWLVFMRLFAATSGSKQRCAYHWLKYSRPETLESILLIFEQVVFGRRSARLKRHSNWGFSLSWVQHIRLAWVDKQKLRVVGREHEIESIWIYMMRRWEQHATQNKTELNHITENERKKEYIFSL